MQKRELGKTGRHLPAMGLGCMGLSEFYGPPTEKKAAIALLHQAIDLGVEHFDTAEMYGIGANETLLGEAFHDRRDKVFIATKFGPTRNPETGEFTGIDGSRENCRRAVKASLERLQTDVIDLYYLHRVDPATPIEETVAAMAELVGEGRVGAIGLSEASADTIRRAAKIHPIAAVQSEYSIFSRDIEAAVIPACIDVGATLVAYSPLGRGMLSGRFRERRPRCRRRFQRTHAALPGRRISRQRCAGRRDRNDRIGKIVRACAGCTGVGAGSRRARHDHSGYNQARESESEPRSV